MQTLYERLKPKYRQMILDECKAHPENIEFIFDNLNNCSFVDNMSVLCADMLMSILQLKFNNTINLTLVDIFDSSHIQSTNNN